MRRITAAQGGAGYHALVLVLERVLPRIADDTTIINDGLRIGRELEKRPDEPEAISESRRKPANKTQNIYPSRRQDDDGGARTAPRFSRENPTRRDVGSAADQPTDRRAPNDTGPRLNQRIRVPEVRVVDAEGNALGVMPARNALALAQERGMDLVEVAPMARPPVCRILDYGKHRYEQAKRRRQAVQKERRSEVKRLQISYGAEAYHLDFRSRDAVRILSEGYRLQVTLVFRGAERKYPEVGRAQMDRLAEGVSSVGVVERPPTLEGRRLTMLLAPK